MLDDMARRSAALALTTVLSLSVRAMAQPSAPAAPVPPVAPTSPAVPVPPVPPVGPAAPATAAAPAAAALPNAAIVRQGVVRLERAGRRLGLGAVLRSDGRILTALSALGHGNFVQARFADESALAVKVVASDRAWDLALLAPEGGHWTEGLRASTLDPPAVGANLARFRVRGARFEEGSVGVAARQVLLGRDGAMLNDAWVLAQRFDEDELGSPLFDARGDVAAIVVQACAPSNAPSCQLTAVGAPVSALKQFLKTAPRREPLPAAYIGLRGAAAHDGAVAGVRVVAVDSGSPAERAGLRAQSAAGRAGESASGDLVVAVEDVPVATPEELRDAINRFALSGATAAQKSGADAAGEAAVRLLVFGSGKFREVKLPVRTPTQLPAAAPAPPLAPSEPAPPPSASSAPAPASDGAAAPAAVVTTATPATP